MADLTAEPAMRAEVVTGLVGLLASHGVRVWLDGGWAVDACLGYQTRWHSDLDVVIENRHLPDAVAVPREHGYRPVSQAGSSPWNFMLGDRDGHQVDIDVITFDAAGNGIYGPAGNGQRYPAARTPDQGPSTAAAWTASHQNGWSSSTPAIRQTRPTGLMYPHYASGSACRSPAITRFRELAAGDQCNTNPAAAPSQERSFSARPARQRLEDEPAPPARR